MNVHLHRSRYVMGWVLAIIFFSPFALILASPQSKVSRSGVTGRVTCSGRPLSDVMICLDAEGGDHSAFGPLGSDGSFQLLSMRDGCPGTAPGRYHAHLYTTAQGAKLPAKYRSTQTSGLEIEIESDWNELDIELE